MMFVTLEEAKLHLRVDGDAEDSDITLKVHAASGAVRGYLKSAADLYLGEDGTPDLDKVPFEVKAATLLMLGHLYKDRDEDSSNAYSQGFLPRPVTALLYPLRDPALA